MSDPYIDPADIDPSEVERVLQRLPFLEREAFLMKARDRMTYAQIGAVLGISPARVEACVASALIKVHTRLFRRRCPWWRALLRVSWCFRIPPRE